MQKCLQNIVIILSLFCFTNAFSQPFFISGKVFVDSIDNCAFDNNERSLKNWKIRVIRPNKDTVFSNSNALGNYQVPISTIGQYSVQVVSESHYWLPCDNPKVINIVTLSSVITNLGVKPSVNCPMMNVSIVIPTLRRGITDTYYVSYSNKGTSDAQNAYVEVILDPFLTLISSSIPTQNLGNSRYRFQLNTVKSNENGRFSFAARLQNNISLGLSHCVEAKIFPDNLCTPSPDYLAQLLGFCNIADPVFTISKLLQQGANVPTKVNIIEDDIVLKVSKDTLKNNKIDSIKPNFQPNKVFTALASLSNGKVIGTAIQRCNLTDSKGFLLQYTKNNGNPFTHTVCGQSQGSIKSIEKQTLPIGRKSQHFVLQNEDLEYTIRFQNTLSGDTVKSVVVTDTLHEALDPTSLEMGASSHLYSWELSQKRILKVTFSNIVLPDSTKDKTNSKGVFTYKISQKKDYKFNTIITNKSQIVLGNQPLKTTNSVFHTIEKPINYANAIVTYCEGSPPPPLVTTSMFPNYDSTTFFTPIQLPLKKKNQSFTVCKGQIITVGNSSYNSNGVYVNKLVANNGCDSVITTTLKVTETNYSINSTVCFGGSISIGGKNFNQSGAFTIPLISKSGCDSIISLALKVLNKTKNDTLTKIECRDSGPFGITYTGFNIKNKEGCDSTYFSALNALKTDTFTFKIIVNKGQFFEFEGKKYKISKDTTLYFDIMTTEKPCDIAKYIIKAEGSTTIDDENPIINIDFYPNPFNIFTTLKIQNSPFLSHCLLIYNSLGQLIFEERNISTTYTLNKEALTQQLYFYRILHDNKVLKEGKLMIY